MTKDEVVNSIHYVRPEIDFFVLRSIVEAAWDAGVKEENGKFVECINRISANISHGTSHGKAQLSILRRLLEIRAIGLP